MTMPIASVPTQKAVEPSVDPAESAPTPTTQQYLNGVSPVAGARLAYYLSKENLGWSLLLLFAADYFGLTNQILGMVGNVC